MAAVRGAESYAEVEIIPKKRKKELRLYRKIPVWICEYHQEVLPYIYRAIGSKHLQFSGITLLHFDSHPDLMAPLEMQAEKVYDKDLLYDIVSIADWILPAVYVGHIKKVIWIKPPWSEQISDKMLMFQVGRHKVEGTIRVSSCERYFCEDNLYVPEEELENCQKLTVVVKTMPVNISHSTEAQSVDLDNLLSSENRQLSNAPKISCTDCYNETKANCKLGKSELFFKSGCTKLNDKSESVCPDTKNFKNMAPAGKCPSLPNEDTNPSVTIYKGISHGQGFQQQAKYEETPDISMKNEDKNWGRPFEDSDNQLFFNEVLSHLEEPFILDVDMDFFSTLNPFKNMFSKEEFETMKRFYCFPETDSNGKHDMSDASRAHKNNVEKLERTLNLLKKSESDIPDTKVQPSCVDLEFMKFIKKWRDSCNEPIDYDMVHSAGMTTNLPEHITDKRDIEQMVKTLGQLLSSLPKPAIITLARSSDDDYTPPSSVEFIQTCLIACLENCYGENVEFFYKYKDV